MGGTPQERTGELLSDLLVDDTDTTETESTIEPNRIGCIVNSEGRLLSNPHPHNLFFLLRIYLLRILPKRYF